jgi:ribonuclease J
MQLIRPQHFVPIHGELRHLKQHAALARSIGIPAERTAIVENGTVLEFRDGRMQVGERIPGGYVFVDGRGVGDIGPAVMRERESLARDGFVLVNLRLNSKTGALVGEPEIHTRGFVFTPDADALFRAARQKVRELASGKENGLPERVERELGKLFYAETKRRPMVLVVSSNGA